MTHNPSEEPTQSVGDNSTDPKEIARKHRSEPPDLERLPEYIGPYKILANLGVGGMGIVYLAEQSTPFRRVAIKIISPLRRSKEVLGRFDIEREALAMMDHPNIARVFDAGESQDGRPYFVMEYVHGIPITEYCDKNKLTTNERLKLFVDVCRAVHHAHQKGIIHRDIKPGNVLVAVQEERPIVKVIDFGVAKAVQQRLTEKTIFTEHGQLIGTPGYMSPEQAEMSALDIDTRTDIYSLGVLLYELLVGAQPFDTRALLAAGFGEIQRVIREVDPPKPSTRLSGLGGDSTVVASNRGTIVRHLSKELRGDLDWITMKCLEKDRMHRYDSATALADDIERHLRSEPVMAGPPSAIYKLRKFTRRHRFGVAAGLGIAAALLVGFIGTAVQYAEKTRQRDRAELEAATAKEVRDFMVDLFKVADPSESLGHTIPVREILDRGAVRIREQLADRPLVKAAMMDAIGNVYSNLGLYEEAEELLREAVEIRKRERPGSHDETAMSLHHLGVVLDRRGQYEAAGERHREGLAMTEQLYGRGHISTSQSLSHLALTTFKRDRRDEAIQLAKEALDIRQALLPSEDARIGASLILVGQFTQAQGDLASAEAHYRAAWNNLVKARGKIHPETADCLFLLADIAYLNGNYEQSMGLHDEVLSMYRQIYGADDTHCARCLNNYGNLMARQEKYDEAEAFVREALAINLKRLGPVHSNVASDLNLLGTVLRGKGQYAEAESNHRASLDMRLQIFGTDHEFVGVSRANLGVCLTLMERFDQAEEQLLEAKRIYERNLPPEHHRRAKLNLALADLYEAWGRPEQESLYRRTTEQN